MALDKKQKILLPLVILAFAYVGWQLYAMLTPSSNSVPIPSHTNKLTASQSESAQLDVKAPTQPSSASSATTAETTSTASTTTATAVTNRQPAPTATATKEQTQYLQLLNQYQLLKMKRMLLDEEVAIASARQKIAELNAQTSKLGGSVDFISDIDNAEGLSSDLTANTGNYAVIYLDHQDGQWNATLNNKGHFEEATIGSTLTDGSKVIAIDATGVTLQQGTQAFKLTFSGPSEANLATQEADEEDSEAVDEAPPASAISTAKEEYEPIAKAQPKKEVSQPKPAAEPTKAATTTDKTAIQPKPEENKSAVKTEIKETASPKPAIEPKKEPAVTKPEAENKGTAVNDKIADQPKKEGNKPATKTETKEITAQKPIVEPQKQSTVTPKPPVVAKETKETTQPKTDTKLEKTTKIAPIPTSKSPATSKEKSSTLALVPAKNPSPSSPTTSLTLQKPPVATTPATHVTEAAPQPADDMKKLLNMLGKNDAAQAKPTPKIITETKNQKSAAPTIVLAPIQKNPAIAKPTPIAAPPAVKTEIVKNTPNVNATNIPTLPPTSGQPDHYALQLMGGEDITDINNFVKANNLANQAAVFKTSRNGKDWYILAYGNYASGKKANDAIKDLPVELKNLEPWAKPIYKEQKSEVKK